MLSADYLEDLKTQHYGPLFPLFVMVRVKK